MPKPKTFTLKKGIVHTKIKCHLKPFCGTQNENFVKNVQGAGFAVLHTLPYTLCWFGAQDTFLIAISVMLLKGIVHPKTWKFCHLLTLSCLFSCVEHKRRYSVKKISVTKQFLVPIVFHNIFPIPCKSMATINCLFTTIPQNILFCA